MADWTIIPAASNTLMVFDFEGTLEAIDEVIAWRIETKTVRDALQSTVVAISVDGDAVSDVIGVQHADGSVTLFGDAKYPSLSEAETQRSNIEPFTRRNEALSSPLIEVGTGSITLAESQTQHSHHAWALRQVRRAA